ncbi:11171_t:CDS:2 [Acaulospora colombiana]|uniref:11171_t:CDS:1 n=1 Tax=Acaulospora colombiana TaxID=27376 RepID=A0ACA9MQ68_9GLOM|nr:11171_t:CDS:2 [Acaulospora colombiana]
MLVPFISTSSLLAYSVHSIPASHETRVYDMGISITLLLLPFRSTTVLASYVDPVLADLCLLIKRDLIKENEILNPRPIDAIGNGLLIDQRTAVQLEGSPSVALNFVHCLWSLLLVQANSF